MNKSICWQSCLRFTIQGRECKGECLTKCAIHLCPRFFRKNDTLVYLTYFSFNIHFICQIPKGDDLTGNFTGHLHRSNLASSAFHSSEQRTTGFQTTLLSQQLVSPVPFDVLKSGEKVVVLHHLGISVHKSRFFRHWLICTLFFDFSNDFMNLDVSPKLLALCFVSCHLQLIPYLHLQVKPS